MGGAARAPGQEPSRLALWLLRWLLFRLMFESGWVKLAGGDESWRHLTALRVHFETQPLPTWIGWYAHQLPAAVQSVCCFLMFVIELVVPFMIFCGRKPGASPPSFSPCSRRPFSSPAITPSSIGWPFSWASPCSMTGRSAKSRRDVGCVSGDDSAAKEQAQH